MNISKADEDSGIHYHIENGYMVKIVPNESGLKIKERIYEYFFSSVYLFMEPEDQNSINWDREHSTDRMDEGINIIDEWEEQVKTAFGASRLLPSWCLSRLWYLTNGRIIDAVESIYEKNLGSTDGGSLYISLLIEKEDIPLAVIQLYGDVESGYLSLQMSDWSPTVSILESQKMLQSFSKWILSDVKQIAVCKVTIKDHELNEFPWEYGFDGKNFLRISQQSVLTWYDTLKNKRLPVLIRQAIRMIEEHPLHHLERGIRTEILNELNESMITDQMSQPFRFNRIKRFQLELEVLQKAAIIWKAAWPEETRIDEMLRTARKLAFVNSEQEREEIMHNWEEYWNYVHNWIHNTWIRGTDHKRYFYSAGLAGVCIVKGLREIDEKLVRFDHLTVDRESIQESYYEDMHFYAASAAANGLPYEMDGYQKGVPDKFQEFWIWWLLEGVPRSI